MSLSRSTRGLQAAGLVIAVIGACGVAHTLGAESAKRELRIDLRIASYDLRLAEQELRRAERALRKVADEARTYERCASREQRGASQ